MINIAELFSITNLKFKNDSKIEAGFIDKNLPLLAQRLSHYPTGFYPIDSLDKKNRYIISEKILTELKKTIRQASKASDIVVKDANKILQDTCEKISREVHLYKKF